MAEILTAAQRVVLARHIARPGTADFIAALFTDFFEQKGDRQNREDPSILGGIALYKGHPVTVIGHRKGRTLEENLTYNFGMPGPEGYRKAQRLMDQAEKFKRPVITFVDTPGAYPGLEAEARGQGEAIARNLMEMSRLTVPRGGGQRRRAGAGRGQPGADAGERGVLHPLPRGVRLHPVEGRRPQRGGGGTDAHDCRRPAGAGGGG